MDIQDKPIYNTNIDMGEWEKLRPGSNLLIIINK